MKWRLGLDLGTNSLGWWAFEINKKGGKWEIIKSLDGGVYIFPDGREPSKAGRVGDGNAVQRRLARGMRRNRDRRRTRLRAYMRELVKLGLMPDSKQERDQLFQTQRTSSTDSTIINGEAVHNNPYYLRAQAVERKLEPYELGRALYHLGLRRGFKSNRIAQNSDEDGGKLKERIDELQKKLGGKTLGQFLWARYLAEGRHRPSGIRFRGENEFYSSRAMYGAEFDAIVEKQASHYPDITKDDWDRLRDGYVLFQHPLKLVERGPCTFFPDHPRHWNDTPIGHDFRIYQEVANLRWIDPDRKEHQLSAEQRDMVLHLLHTRTSKVKFDSIRKQKRKDKSLYFPEEECVRFNLEDEKRKGLKGHFLGARLAKDEVLAPLWSNRCSIQGDGGMLDDIFEMIQMEPDDDALRDSLGELRLDKQTIEALIHFPSPNRATAHVSRQFMEEIVPIMRDQGLPYSEAMKEMKDEKGNALHHSKFAQEQSRETLPYYGEIIPGMLGKDPQKDPQKEPEKHFGKINNPTVHVALNSLRRVVNALIERFGSCPTEIHVELTRDLKLPRWKRDEITRRQAKQQSENQRIRKLLKSHGIENPTARDIKKVRLWEELGNDELSRRCPFTGEVISLNRLMNGDAEIEHLLPFTRTLDDSMSNLTVAMRYANRLKGNKTPYEAFALDKHGDKGIEWSAIRHRTEKLPVNKAWRFGPDAMNRFEGDNDFIARQLTDNAYIAKTATGYLSCLQGVEQIVPNRGGLTALLRGKWGLNRILSEDSSKNREDHRHHAIDAAVIGLANRSVLQSISRQTARISTGELQLQVPDMPIDIETLHAKVGEIVVAFKPDHGWEGRMYNETAYGFVEEENLDPDFPDYNLVTRKPIQDLSRKEYLHICDPQIRKDMQILGNMTPKEQKECLTTYSRETGIRKVRIFITNQAVSRIPSAPYKGYAPEAYVCCDVWRLPKGKKGAWKQGEYRWEGKFWAYPETPSGVPDPERGKPHPAAKFVCRLFKNDMVTYKDDENNKIVRVAGFSTTDNRLDLALHTNAAHKQTYFSINQMGQKGLRKLHVTPDGKVKGL